MSYLHSKSRTLLVASFVAILSAGVLFAQQSSNIGNLIGRTDANLNLYVRSAAVGGAGQSSNIGGLVGRTDADLNLYVTMAADSIVTVATLNPTAAQLTAGTAAGVTTVPGTVAGGVVTKYTVATTAFVCNAVTCDVTLGTLPVNTRLDRADAAITTVFACASVCTTSTLSLILGKGAAGAEYLATFDADAATGWFGDADAEMGTLMTRAAAIQGGTFSATAQALVLRLTSGTGNVGNGTITNLSTGVLVVRVQTTVMP